MTNKVWCDDIYELNFSNTTFTYEHDPLYRKYAATSIGDLIDKMQDNVEQLTSDNKALEDQMLIANKAREDALEYLDGAVKALDI